MSALGIDLAAGAASDAGRLRHDNQDAVHAGRSVVVVSDGMGGHVGGAAAAQAVVAAFADADGDAEIEPADVSAALNQAYVAVLGVGGQGAEPGATVTGVAVARHDGVPSWLVFNVGDSRTYLLRQGSLRQVTVDHSRRQQLIDAGVPREEVERRVGANVITRAVGAGMPAAPEADLWLLPALVGDRLLLCTDGVSGELSDELLTVTLLTSRDPQDAADAVVASAVSAGGRDNATAAVVDALAVHGGDVEDVRWSDTLGDTLGGGLDFGDEDVDTREGELHA